MLTPETLDEVQATAYHEAGHAVYAVLSGRRVLRVLLAPEDRPNALGVVDLVEEDRRFATEEHIEYGLSGILGERIYRSEQMLPPSEADRARGAADDLATVEAEATMLYETYLLSLIGCDGSEFSPLTLEEFVQQKIVQFWENVVELLNTPAARDSIVKVAGMLRFELEVDGDAVRDCIIESFVERQEAWPYLPVPDFVAGLLPAG